MSSRTRATLRHSQSRPHKPVAAVGTLFLLLNGLLLYISGHYLGGSGQPGITPGSAPSHNEKKIESIESLVSFTIENNTIFYQGQKISLQEFKKRVEKLNQQKKAPELLFIEDTVTASFYERISSYLKENNIIFRENFQLSKN